MGEYEKAISELRKGVALSGGSLGIIAELGHAYAVAGKRREAFQILRELKDASKRRYVSPFLMALIYTGLGEKDQGFLWLEKAYEDRSNLMSSLNVDPRFDPFAPILASRTSCAELGYPSNLRTNQSDREHHDLWTAC
jgi:tetratricopeptide (TPR) repeat protein